MSQSYAFKNKQGNLGLFQKDGDVVHYHINNGMFPIYGCHSWTRWVHQVEAGYQKGDKENPTPDSISFYLSDHAESVNHEVQNLVKVENPGYHYPRINRGNIEFNYINDSFHQDIRAYRNIQGALDALFDMLEPNQSNFNSYGHKIRELLILACTEVEYLLLKVITENGYEQKDIYRTSDYVACLDALRLGSFKAELIQYPSIKTFAPFQGWSKESPTKSLPWYDAYNAVKHNRGDNIAKANFEHVLDAVAAIHILLEAQYGIDIFSKWKQYSEDRSLFITVTSPSWEPNEVAVPIFEGYEKNARWLGVKEYFLEHPIKAFQRPKPVPCLHCGK